MNAIIIAAGSGIRLGKLTKKIPKSMLKVNGKSILERQVELFKKHGIKNVFVITGPNSKKFDLKNIFYIKDENYQKHDILESLMVAKNNIKNDIIISYSDIIIEEKILIDIVKSIHDIGVVVDLNWKKAYNDRKNHPLSEAENVMIKNGEIKKIKKNISEYGKNEKIGEFLGLIKLSNKGSKILVKQYVKLKKTHVGKFQNANNLDKAYLTDIIQELIDNNFKISPIEINGKWCEIDTEEDLEKAKNIFHEN